MGIDKQIQLFFVIQMASKKTLYASMGGAIETVKNGLKFPKQKAEI